MTTQTGCISKQAAYLCLLLFLLLPSKYIHAASANNDVNNLTETAALTANAFLQESFDLRLKYQFNGCFLNDVDKQNLYTLATKASDRLHIIERTQQELKTKIESYQGSDWDDKYGATGLWRKTVSDLYVTTLSSCSVDFYRALAAPPDEKTKILLDILTRLDSFDKSFRSADATLIKAKTSAQLARTELSYKSSAIHQLNSIVADANIPESIRFRTEIERIGFLGSSDPEKVNELLKKIAHSSYRDDLELVLPLAFFQRQKDPEAFAKIVEKWPQAQNSLAPLVLGEIADKQDITEISAFDVELAVLAAWKNNPQNYTQLLEKIISVEKFRTPLVLYVTGIAFAENAPAKSIDFLTQASKLQQAHKNPLLDIEPEKIAEQAAKLAYNLFLKDSSTCPLATEAFRNYLAIADYKTDVQLSYFYTSILNQCGQPEKAKELLRKIAAVPDTGPAGIWRKRAALDLILQTTSQNPTEAASRASILNQLTSLITDCQSDNNDLASLRTEAITIYCQLLLETNDSASAQKALDILNNSQANRRPALALLKSKALLHLDKLPESAKLLLDINDFNDTAFYSHTMELLSRVVEKIDWLQMQEKNSQPLLQNCKKLAQVCYTNLQAPQKHRAGLYLAEIIIFSDENQQEKISQVNKLLYDLAKNKSEDLSLTRCQARLLAEQGKFEQAADLWAKIANALEAHHLDRWWQARYFELDCAAKVRKIPKNNIAHSIEVLESSFPGIPPFWAQKLKLLKQNCLADISNN